MGTAYKGEMFNYNLSIIQFKKKVKIGHKYNNKSNKWKEQEFIFQIHFPYRTIPYYITLPPIIPVNGKNYMPLTEFICRHFFFFEFLQYSKVLNPLLIFSSFSDSVLGSIKKNILTIQNGYRYKEYHKTQTT